ncbi:MAG TPA: hypothetical protein IAB38_06205 [Candidatus Onthousia excrementipullorum]|uniref:Uncharacterized protein n=1 Tax=Candidatus Onthousia excrementipullorum TaxID=2840884 RepID=A0A9D1DV97_9FIRM|nr:hypothetical protein [Candidatus Onthousia excrementipullorum]
MENKKSKTGLHVFVGILLGIIICGGVVFATYELGYLTFNGKEEKVDTENDNATNNDQTEEDTSASSLEFDTSNIKNGGESSYTLANYSGTINISIDETGKVATLSYNRATLSNTYLLNWDLTGVEEGVLESQTITFNNKVNDVLFSGIGQDRTGDIILFLMEDGTIAYIPVYQTLSTNGAEGLATYQTISNVKDVVKFYTASVTSGTSSGVTVLAQTKDGTLYDLAPMINNTSNNE